MFWHDLRYALRQLRRAPGFALTVTLTLALGIGASSAIFCLMDALWLHPLHVPQPGRIVRVFATSEQFQEGLFSYPDYQAMAQRATAFQGGSGGLVVIGGRGSLMPRPDGTAQMLTTDAVSANFFTVLGVRPLLGRLFTAKDAALMRSHPGVVLGHSCWERDFAGNPDIVGRSITLMRGKDARVQFDVLGVLPPSFREVNPDSDRCLWMAVESWATFRSNEELTSSEFHWLNVLGRLGPGASVAEANQQVAAIAGALAAAYPATDNGRSARAISDFDYRMSLAGTSGLVLFAIVCGVVLLAVVNVAHLLLSRALARAPEVALRFSLGATRRAIARQLLLENLLLGIFSLGAGLALATAVAALLPHLLVLEPAMLESYRSGLHLHIDARVYFFASLLALVTMVLLAFVPLGQVARPALLPIMQAHAATRTSGRVPIARRAAVWLQIGISFALLVSTGALIRSFLNTHTQDIGLTRKQVLVAFTQDPESPLRDALVANLRRLPGAENVAYGIRSPLMPSEGGIATKVVLTGHPELHDPVTIKYNAVSPDFLKVTGTRIVRGRGFTESDDVSGPPVIIISHAMARKYWPGQDPIGQLVTLPGFGRGTEHGASLEARIIGVAQDAPINQIGEIPEPYMYIPFHLSRMGEITFVVATRQNAMSIAQEARQVFIHANPLLDPIFVTSLPELIRYSAGNYQMMAELVSALGLIGLALTIVGLYGFLAFRVTQRGREIGIRMALGASREATTWLILRDTLRMAVIGLAIGAVLAVAAGRLESAALFGVRALDLRSFIAALAVLAAAMAAAAWLPARRAASIDPMQAIRTE